MRIETPFPEFSDSLPNTKEIVQLQCWMSEMRQKGIKLDSHVRLFIYEFLQHLGPQEEFDQLLQTFAADKCDLLKQYWREAKDKAILIGRSETQAKEIANRTVQSDLFKFISYSEHQHALPYLLAIIARCKEANPMSYEELHLNSLPNIDFYIRLYHGPDKFKMDRIRAVLEPKHIITYLRGRNVNEYDSFLKRVDSLYHESKPEKRDVEAAASLLIRGLVHCTDGRNSTRETGEWYIDFIKAMLSHGDCRMIPPVIDPNFQDDLDRWKAKKETNTGPVGCEALADLVLEDDDNVPSDPRNQTEYVKYRNSDIDEYEPNTVELRSYQIELASHANSGRNTIVCAPTGSGKTQIAVDIMKKHLELRHREGKVGRCVLLVPTVPLVDQQALQMTEFLMDFRDQHRPDLPYWVDGFSGCENSAEGRAYRLLASDICVMTPQILINMMNSVLRSERVYFADFTLMIFDECHHAHKQHPYKILMDMLERSRIVEPPQIVGLTASMGVGDTSWDMQACKQHMLELCSNLRAESISTVRHQMDDLKSFVMPPVDRVERVRRPRNNAFIEKIEEVMGKIEKRMSPVLEDLVHSKDINLTLEEIKFPQHVFHSRYQTMVGTLRKMCQRVQESEMRFLLVRSIDHLSHYFHAILISDLLPNSYALEYLRGKMANYEKNSDTGGLDKINNDLLKLYKDLDLHLGVNVQGEEVKDKEILWKLYQILRDQFVKEEDSRCLIFVATRNCAQKLADHLNSTHHLPMLNQKVGFMVSSNQSQTAGGQSSQDQKNMITDFDKGKIKVLVVTSVAEEGVNIVACNLIIKYNNVGSERSMIQRRGRARQKNSRSILLALDINIEDTEYKNLQKEVMMMRCIEDLQEKTELALKKEIAAKRNELEKIRENHRRMLEQKRSMLSSRRYKLCCQSCGALICQSSFIRSVADSLFVVCDPTVWQRSKIGMSHRPTKDQLTTKCANWVCKDCPGQEWGKIVKYSNCYLPQLTANSFTLEREDQHEEVDYNAGSRRTWNQVQDQFFNVDPITTKNIREIYAALLSEKPRLIKDMDKQERLANIKFLEKLKEKKTDRKSRIQLFLEE